MKKFAFSVTASLFVITSIQSQTMAKRTTVISHPEWSRHATVYEVNIRQYTPEGTFKAFEQHLPRLQKMGIRILWLMPVNPIGIKNRKGTLGSYYSVKDYLAVNPEFGSLRDFRELVKTAHSLGMYVIIDWVANHTAWDNPLIKVHPEWYLHDSAGRIISPVADWTDVAGLDYSKSGLRKYMCDAMIYWVRETDIDGFRCDVAGMLPIGFWNETVPKIKKVKEVFMLAEAESPEMHDSAFDATYSWDFFHLMNSIAKGNKSADKLDSLYNREKKKYQPDSFRLRFTSNHDENTWNGTEYERMGEGALAFAVLTFTFPGMPLVYSGQEAALKKRLRFFDKDTISWKNYPLERFYSSLIQLKTQNKALANGIDGGGFIKIQTTNDKAVYAFLRKKETDKIFVLINLSGKDQDIQLTGTEFPGTYKELFTGKIKNWSPGERVQMLPWQYLVFVSE